MERRSHGKAQFSHRIRLLQVPRPAEPQGSPDLLILGKTADHQRLLAGRTGNDALIGLAAVQTGPHEHIQQNQIGLTFSELLDFSDECQSTVAELGLLLTGTNWDPKQFANVHEKNGKAMWRTLAGLT